MSDAPLLPIDVLIRSEAGRLKIAPETVRRAVAVDRILRLADVEGLLDAKASAGYVVAGETAIMGCHIGTSLEPYRVPSMLVLAPIEGRVCMERGELLGRLAAMLPSGRVDAGQIAYVSDRVKTVLPVVFEPAPARRVATAELGASGEGLSVGPGYIYDARPIESAVRYHFGMLGADGAATPVLGLEEAIERLLLAISRPLVGLEGALRIDELHWLLGHHRMTVDVVVRRTIRPMLIEALARRGLTGLDAERGMKAVGAAIVSNARLHSDPQALPEGLRPAARAYGYQAAADFVASIEEIVRMSLAPRAG